MTNPDGGPAFPHDVLAYSKNLTDDNIFILKQGLGMSLRDWFAGMALKNNPEIDATPEHDAKRAYMYADAMLKERDKRNEDS